QVVVVNETFVRLLLNDLKSVRDAVGRRVSTSGERGPFVKIVGVVKDGKYFNISEEPRSFLWGPISQNYSSSASLVVRTSRDPRLVLPAVRNELRSLDPTLPLYDVKTFEEHMRLPLFPARI